jgi:hypothetical protein
MEERSASRGSDIQESFTTGGSELGTQWLETRKVLGVTRQARIDTVFTFGLGRGD